MKLVFELYKNFKILFRNFSSLALLILGPLTLIMLIGFAYSGEGIHSITIGVISNDYKTLEPAIANFTSFAKIEKYVSNEACLKDLVLQKLHVCLEFSSNFNQDEEFPSGTIIFYYDNSRKVLSEKLVDELSKYFGLQAEKISIETAQGIFENIQNMVVYLHGRSTDIDTLVKESSEIRSSLLERRQKLMEIREQFLPIYQNMIELQEDINKTDENLTIEYSRYRNSSEKLALQLKGLKESLPLLDYDTNLTIEGPFNLSYYNYTFNNSNISIPRLNISLKPDPLFLMITKVEDSLSSINRGMDNYYGSIKNQKDEFDSAVSLVSSIKIMIDSDIDVSYVYAEKIRVGNEKMLEAQIELNKSIQGLTKLDPKNAEKLVKPILENFEPILPGLKNIRIAFPGMLAIIIIFISILFANILTLSEINSRAFQRNIIAPVNKRLFLSGLIITNLIIVLFQVFVLLAVAEFSFKIEIMPMLFLTLLVIILLILIFTFLGMIFALIMRNEQTSILTTTFVALSFFLFSDAIAPLETMPKLASLIASFNPFVIASSAFRKLLIFGLPAVNLEISILTGYLFALGLMLYFSSKNI